MYKQTMGFVKGLGTGVAAGVAMLIVGNRMMKKNRKFRRNANRAMKTVDGLIDNVEVMFH